MIVGITTIDDFASIWDYLLLDCAIGEAYACPQFNQFGQYGKDA